MLHVCNVTGRLYFKTPYALSLPSSILLPLPLSLSLSHFAAATEIEIEDEIEVEIEIEIDTRAKRTTVACLPAPQPRLGRDEAGGGTTCSPYVLSFRITIDGQLYNSLSLSLCLPCIIVAQNCGGCKKG